MSEMVYESHIMQNPKLPFYFHINTHLSSSKHEYAFSNWHDNIELIYCTHGKGLITLDTEEIFFSKGETVVINANVMHRILPADEVKYHCLIIDRYFCKSNDIDTDRLHFRTKFQDEKIAESFAKLEHLYIRDNDALKIAKIRKCVLDIMIRLAENYLCDESNYAIPKEKTGIDRIKSAIVYISENLSEKLELEKISAHAGVSKYHFSRQFKAITGLTVIEYINNCRCKYAKQLIEEGLPVSEAAERSGFENMSYFTKTFKKYIGRLPSKL